MKVFLKKIYFSSIKIFFDLLYSELKIADKKFYNKNIKIREIKFSKKSKKKFKIYEIKKSRIYSDFSENVAIIKDKFIIQNLSTQVSKNFLLDVAKNSILQTGTRRFIQKKIDGNVLSLIQGVSAINNYGHWMIDILPKLCITEQLKKLNNFDAIYLPNINLGFQKQSLKYFKINKAKLIDGSKINHIYANKVTIPQHPYWEIDKDQMMTADVNPEIIKILRKKFLKNIKKIKKIKIFIDRSDSKFHHNQIENYDEVINILKDHKFKIIKLTNKTIQKQISYFKNAKIVVGAHGAGLSNSIFCDPKTKLIEITSKGYTAPLLKNISRINKMKHLSLVSSKSLPTDRVKPDIYVPIKKLIKLIT